jgi:protein TonB
MVAPAPVEPIRATEPVPQVQAPAAVSVPAARTEAAKPSAPVPAADTLDPQTIGQYRVAIIAAARRFKRYPRIALDNNWEGKAEIRLVIGTDGNIASISVRGLSGFEVLDQQALEMIRRAKGQEPVPTALRGKAFTLDVPVVFSLREEGG